MTCRDHVGSADNAGEMHAKMLSDVAERGLGAGVQSSSIGGLGMQGLRIHCFRVVHCFGVEEA